MDVPCLCRPSWVWKSPDRWVSWGYWCIYLAWLISRHYVVEFHSTSIGPGRFVWQEWWHEAKHVLKDWFMTKSKYIMHCKIRMISSVIWHSWNRNSSIDHLHSLPCLGIKPRTFCQWLQHAFCCPTKYHVGVCMPVWVNKIHHGLTMHELAVASQYPLQILNLASEGLWGMTGLHTCTSETWMTPGIYSLLGEQGHGLKGTAHLSPSHLDIEPRTSWLWGKHANLCTTELHMGIGGWGWAVLCVGVISIWINLSPSL